MRIGQGYDVHAFEAGRPLVLAGVRIAHTHGLAGHSDGDVVLHAVADALLGALGEGDLGRHFPSSDESLRGIDSRLILERVVGMLRERQFCVANLDATVVAQAPRLSAHQADMQKSLIEILGADPGSVNLKVTSTDRLGAIGRSEGIAAMAVVLIEERKREL